MTTLTLCTLMGAVWACPCTQVNELPQIQHVIASLQPSNSEYEARAIARSVDSAARKYDLDWKVLVAILFQESSLKRDPSQCFQGKRCIDFGIAQINWATWGVHLGLNKERLSSDIAYNVEAGAYILSRYKRLYAARDPDWFGRYHSGNPENSRPYLKKLVEHRVKIKEYLRGYSDAERRLVQQNLSYHPRLQGVLLAGSDSNAVRVLHGSSREILKAIQPEPFDRRKIRPRRQVERTPGTAY